MAVGKTGDIGIIPMVWGFHFQPNNKLIINTRSETAPEKPLFIKTCWRGAARFPAPGIVNGKRGCPAKITDKKTGEITEADPYSVSSLSDIETFARAVRQHWGIEASLHHVLDVSFSEDASKIHKDHALDNLAVIRHFVLSALAFLDVGKKNVSALRKRKMCGRNPQLLLLALDRILADQSSS